MGRLGAVESLAGDNCCTRARMDPGLSTRPTHRWRPFRDDVVSGLALAIQPTGVRTWFLARMVRGRRRYATIGSADAMTIP